MKKVITQLDTLVSKFEYSVASLVWFFPISYFAVLLGHFLLLDQGANLIKLNLFALGISIVSCGSLVLISMLINQIIVKQHKARFKLTAILLIGAARGAAIYYSAMPLGLDSGVSLSYRIWNSSVTTLVWISLISYVVNRQRHFQSRYRRLISQSIMRQSSGISEAELSKYLGEIEQSLKAIEFDSNQPRQLERAAQKVKDQIDELIRPLSKRLWLDSINSYPKIKFARVLIEAIANLKISVIPVGVFYLVTSIINLASLIPLQEAVIRSVVNVALAVFLYFILDKIKFFNQRNSFLIGVTKLFIIAVLPNFISQFVYSVILIKSASGFIIVTLLPLPILLIMFSVLKTITLDRNYLLENLDKKFPISDSNYQKTQVASYLHNSLQSELLALAKKLEIAALSEATTESRASLEQLSALLNRSISQDFANFYDSPKDRLSQVISNWAGILDIKIFNQLAVFTDPAKSVVAIQIIEELASNVMKHSAATELIVTCSIQEKVLVLETIAPALLNLSALTQGSGLLSTYLVGNKSFQRSIGESMLRFEI